jgi:hypothetical protein
MGQSMAQGPTKASASTHQAALGWETSTSRCMRNTEGGCRDSQKTHSLQVVDGERKRNHMSNQFRKGPRSQPAFVVAFLSYMNCRYFS